MERREEQSASNGFCDTRLRITPSSSSDNIDPLAIFNIVFCGIVRMDFYKRFRFLTDKLRHFARPGAGMPLALNPSGCQSERELFTDILVGWLIDRCFELCLSRFSKKPRTDVPGAPCRDVVDVDRASVVMSWRVVHLSFQTDRMGCLLSAAGIHPKSLQRCRNRNSV